MTTTMMAGGIGLSEECSREGVRVLTQLLADQHVLFQKLRNYHWNVRGLHFSELHALFERQYELLGKKIDEVAERIRQLGCPAPATMTEILQLTNLTEYPEDYPNASVMVGNILEDHESVIRWIRSQLIADDHCVLDDGTIDLLIQTMRDHEKMAWILRATLSVVGDQPVRAEADPPNTYHAEYFQYHGG